MEEIHIQEWLYPSQKVTAREQLLMHITNSFIPLFSLNITDKVFQVSLGSDIVTERIASNVPEGSVTTIEFKSMPILMDKPSTISEHEEEFDVVISFWHLQYLNMDHQFVCNSLFQTLKKGGRFCATFPTLNTSTRKTYQKVIEKGAFPDIETEIPVEHSHFLENAKDYIKSLPFEEIKFSNFKGGVLLPRLEIFKQYLHDISFLYKKVTPSIVSDEIIDMQVTFFKEHCDNVYDGQLIFEYECIVANAIK